MPRPLYLAALLVLQLSLTVNLARPVADAIRIDTSPGLAPSGWPVMLQVTATATAVIGAALLLAAPSVAWLRHWQDGPFRYAGLPRWAVGLALAGTAMLAAGAVCAACLPLIPVEGRMTAILIARPAIDGGLALAAAGVVSAELLRHCGAGPPASPSVGPHGERT